MVHVRLSRKVLYTMYAQHGSMDTSGKYSVVHSVMPGVIPYNIIILEKCRTFGGEPDRAIYRHAAHCVHFVAEQGIINHSKFTTNVSLTML